MVWTFGDWIFYGFFIFIAFVLLVAGITMFVLWNRRKLIFCNFLSDTGQWERQSYKPQQLAKTFEYDGETYKYDIKKCTRDRLNRPIAHYYKGNPEQQIFDFNQTNKTIHINAQDITAKDFLVLMTSKVLRDIFQDEEVMNMLWIILIATIVIGLIVSIIVFTHNPPCTLKNDNQTISIIAQGVRQGILKK